MTGTRLAAAQDGGGHLVRAIGFFGVAWIALNSVIGGGIFGLPPAVVARAGVASPWLFLLVGALVITMVLTFAKLASYFRESGGPVLFTTTAFGPLVGFGTGWVYYISRITAFAANATLLAAYLGSLWAPAATSLGRATIITAVCAVLTGINYVGVRDGVRALWVLTLLKIAPVLVLIAFGLRYVTPDTALPAQLPAIEDPGATILMMMFAFVGFESTTIVSGESIEPRRTLPSALIRTTLFIAVFYFLVVLAYVAVLPYLDGGGATLVDMGGFLFGPPGAFFVTLAAVFSIGGNLGAILLAVPRLTYALSRDQLLPRWFGEVHARYATPGNSIVFLGASSLALALSGTFTKLIVASSLTRLITYILCIAALPLIHRRATEAQREASYGLRGGYTIPALALAICLWITAQSGVEEWLFTAGLFALGMMLYGVARLTHRRAPDGGAPTDA